MLAATALMPQVPTTPEPVSPVPTFSSSTPSFAPTTPLVLVMAPTTSLMSVRLPSLSTPIQSIPPQIPATSTPPSVALLLTSPEIKVAFGAASLSLPPPPLPTKNPLIIYLAAIISKIERRIVTPLEIESFLRQQGIAFRFDFGETRVSSGLSPPKSR